MRLSSRQDSILDLLRRGSHTTSFIADQIAAPEASVRRDIQVLRAAGYNIVYRNGFMTLNVTTPELATA